MPRKYDLGKRAAQQAATRRRILDAAMALYQEQGVSATTMLDVARRADVAPGTVANHFGSASALAAEVSRSILGDLHMPTPDLFDGVEGLPDRIGLLVRELSAFFERSEPWWRASQRDPADGGFWADAAARYYTDLDTLVRVALGPRSSDDDAVAVITTLFNAWVLGMLQTTGRTEDEAVELVSRLLIAWLETRAVPDRP